MTFRQRLEPAFYARVQDRVRQGLERAGLDAVVLDDPDDVVCTTQGRPLSEGDEVRVVDEHGVDLPDGEAGALLTRGPYTPRGYYRAPEQNARAFTPDGWYASGDVVRRRVGEQPGERRPGRGGPGREHLLG